MHKIVEISVFSMFESCNRTTFFVRATTDDGMTMEVEGHRTGSDYTNGEGLSIEEARDRALMDADTWGQFLGIKPTPFIVDGVEIEPSMTLGTYDIQREMRAEREAKKLRESGAAIIAENTGDAYSAGNYPDGEWAKCAQLLIDRGLNQEETEAFLRSKHMRWCYDNAEDPCNATARDFETYLNNGRNIRGSLKEEARNMM